MWAGSLLDSLPPRWCVGVATYGVQMTLRQAQDTAAGSAPSLTTERNATAARVIAAMAGPDARLREDQTVAVAALSE